MFRETETNPQMSLFDNPALAVNGVFTGIQGRQSAYLLDESDGGGTVRITDTRTGETYEAKLTRSGALRIPYLGDRTKYKWRYFLPKQLESMRSRKRMNDIPQEEKNKRNNVEATIFQLCFHTRNNKTRYRGKRKHELWALARCTHRPLPTNGRGRTEILTFSS